MEERVYQGQTYRRSGPGQPWQRVSGGDAPQRVQVKPADPNKQPKDETELAILRARLEGLQGDNSTLGLQTELLRAQAAKAEADAKKAAAEAQGGVKADQRMANLRALQQNIARVRQLYTDNLKGGWPNAIAGNVPFRPSNDQFNSAGAGLAESGLAAFRVPGVGSQSDAELRAFVDANRPFSSDSDLAIEEKLRNLETRLNAALGEMGPQATSGAQGDNRDAAALAFGGQGSPGGGTPMDPFGLGGPIVLPQAKGARDQGPMQANDVTSKGGLVPISELAGYENNIIDMIGRGATTQQVVAYMNEQLGPYGGRVGGDQQAWIDGIVQKHRANPRQPVRSLGQGWEMLYHKKAPEEQQSFLGIDPDSTVGNFLAQGSSAMLAGAPAYMAGKQDVLGAAARERPGSTLAGEIAGGTAGMLGINRLAGAAGKYGSLLTRSGGVGGDMAFGATRGAFDGGPEGAIVGGLTAGLGNKVGGGLVRTVGRGVRGVSDPAVRYLAERGVPMTTGQLLGNRGLLGKTMNKLESLPVVGDSLAARRIESMAALNRAAMEDAGRGIGFNPSATGFEGVESGLAAAGNAMDNAVAGVDVPMDQLAIQEMRAALAAGKSLPDDLAARFGKAIDNRVAPALDTGRLTGKDYQQTVRGIRGYQAETPKPGFEADYRDALGSVEDALTGAVTRGAGREVADNLTTANRAYRDFGLLRDAVTKAQGGSASGAQEIFTPAQLQAAVRGSKYAKSGTKEPFGKLTRSGQEVLPSTIPNSGTADRAMAMALPGLLGGGAAAVGNYVDPKAAVPLAVLAALSSRTGAKVAQKALTGRSTAARAMGRKIIQQRRKAGLFGASTGVAVLPQSSQ